MSASVYEVRGAIGRWLDGLGLRLGAVEAVFVTHHHADHIGVAERVRFMGSATVFVGEGDATVVRGDRPSHPPAGFWQHLP